MGNRFQTENRRAKAEALARVIRATAREYKTPLLAVFPENDVEWFRVWQRAKCASAPSEETKALCREIAEQMDAEAVSP